MTAAVIVPWRLLSLNFWGWEISWWKTWEVGEISMKWWEDTHDYIDRLLKITSSHLPRGAPKDSHFDLRIFFLDGFGSTTNSFFFFEVIKPQLGNFPVQSRCPSDRLHMAISWASALPRRPRTGKVAEVLLSFSPNKKATISRCKGGTQKPVVQVGLLLQLQLFWGEITLIIQWF